MQSKAPGLAPVSIDGFEFPDSVYFSTRLPSLLEGLPTGQLRLSEFGSVFFKKSHQHKVIKSLV
eukprot:3167277-Amphidinium_carterae.1